MLERLRGGSSDEGADSDGGSEEGAASDEGGSDEGANSDDGGSDEGAVATSPFSLAALGPLPGSWTSERGGTGLCSGSDMGARCSRVKPATAAASDQA